MPSVLPSAIDLGLAHLATLGGRIKAQRKQQQLTLKELSQLSGIPLSTLSKVENGQMSLNVGKLLKLCAALKVDVMQLVSQVEQAEEPSPPSLTITGRRSITRRGEAEKVVTNRTTYHNHARDYSRKKMVPFVMEIKSGAAPELIRHQGEEFIYVLEGVIEVHTEFYEPTILREGESIYLDSTMAHNVRSLEGTARVLNIMTQPAE